MKNSLSRNDNLLNYTDTAKSVIATNDNEKLSTIETDTTPCR